MARYIFLLLFLVPNGVLCDKGFNFDIPPDFHQKMMHFKQQAIEVLDTAGGGTQCAKDLKEVINDIYAMKKWAIEMLDAMAKFPSGILSGNIFVMGAYDQCVNVNIFNKTAIHGEYCPVLLQPKTKEGKITVANVLDFFNLKTNFQKNVLNQAMRLPFGICVPSSCREDILQDIWDHAETVFKPPVSLEFLDGLCTSLDRSPSPFPIDSYIQAFFIIYIALLAFCTWYDVYIDRFRQEHESNSFLVSFSFYSNAKKLLKLKESSQDDIQVDCMCGIKVFCMLSVIHGHRVATNTLTGITNAIPMYNVWRREIYTSFVISGPFAVDSFLTMSGMLMSLGILKFYYLKENKALPILSLYFHRLWRLCPALIAIILFYISIVKHIYNGPVWNIWTNTTSRNCYEHWFKTLTFTNNIGEPSAICVEQSWYLSVDMQLFFISPPLLYILVRNPVRACMVCVAICLTSGIYSYISTIQNNHGANYFEVNVGYFEGMYLPTKTRLPPYFIGIIFGYIVYRYKNIKLRRPIRYLAWVAVIGTMFGLILVHLVYTRATSYSPVRSALFNGGARQLWAIAQGCFIILCITDKNGLMNQVLSLPIFQRLVRLSYSFYLTHLIVIWYFVGSKRSAVFYTNVNTIHDFMGDSIFTFIISIFWCLAFESPFVALGQLMSKRKGKPSHSSSDMDLILPLKKKKEIM
ncbi:nose resistant to fluoxetine protein 6-like [Diabrotica undecimpunctata]|uniref:nose resistant to fluoxetine protein 6-like n=1 Tax=Diabrotica undecimpunctata TaxID=50387 RepID=UPI003B63D1CE